MDPGLRRDDEGLRGFYPLSVDPLTRISFMTSQVIASSAAQPPGSAGNRSIGKVRP
jgi:hypothetical protein